MLFVGVDAGGTKTHALVVDEAGVVRGVGRAGAGNWEGVGLEGTHRVLQQAVEEALAQADASPDEISAAGYGLAGLDWPSDETRLRPVVARLGVGGPQVLVNDTFVALRAGVPWGVVIIAGTGTTVAGRNSSGQTARTLGLGYPFDDWGSAPELAQACLYAVACAYTGRGPATALSGHLMHLVGARDETDLLEGLSRKRYELWPFVTQIVQVLFQEAQSGDEAAQGVVRRGGRALGGGAVAVIRRLGLEQKSFDVVLAGGLFRSHSPLLLETLEGTVRAVAPRAVLSPLEAPPAVGGALLAMEAAGLQPASGVHQRLKEEACCRLP